MGAVVIVIEHIPGSVTERDIRDQANAIATRLGGVCTVSYPLVASVETPTVWQLLCGSLARIKTTAAVRRVNQE